MEPFPKERQLFVSRTKRVFSSKVINLKPPRASLLSFLGNRIFPFQKKMFAST